MPWTTKRVRKPQLRSWLFSLPAYGTTFTLWNSAKKGVGAPIAGAVTPGKYTQEGEGHASFEVHFLVIVSKVIKINSNTDGGLVFFSITDSKAGRFITVLQTPDEKANESLLMHCFVKLQICCFLWCGATEVWNQAQDVLYANKRNQWVGFWQHHKLPDKRTRTAVSVHLKGQSLGSCAKIVSKYS